MQVDPNRLITILQQQNAELSLRAAQWQAVAESTLAELQARDEAAKEAAKADSDQESDDGVK